MQLGSQFGSQNLILTKIVALMDKPETKPHPVNVYNNMCSPAQPKMISKDSQTCNQALTDQATIVNNRIDDVPEPEDTNENVEQILKCTVCSSTLESSTHLDNHMELVHGTTFPQSVQCDHCDVRLPSSEELRKHKALEHAADYIQCPECKFRCQSREQLSDHVTTCHPQPGTSTGGNTPAVIQSSATSTDVSRS